MKTRLLFLLLSLSLLTNAQQPVGALAIGDMVPDITFADVYNHGVDTLRLSDYRGKLVILDFWHTWCISCLQAFPKVDSLQLEYGDRIQFLAVSTLGLQETDDFFREFARVHRPEIPFITGDSLLSKLFPHQGLPFHVWITAEGRVLHLTGGAYLTREKLDLALAGKPTGIPAVPTRMTYLKTLLDTAYDAEIAFASYLVRWNSLKNFRIEKPTTPNEYTVSGDIQRMFQYLYRQLGGIGFDPFRTGRTRVITQTPERFAPPAGLTGERYIDWADRHLYFYQGRVPETDSTILFQHVKTDLERFFGMHSAVRDTVVECWTLVRIDSVDRLRTRGGDEEYTFYAENIRTPLLPPYRSLKNCPYGSFSSAITSLVERLTGRPCMDETGYVGNIDITFRGETLDRPSMDGLRQELEVYGLDLIPASKRLGVLVLLDIK